MTVAMKESILLGYYQVCLNRRTHKDQIILVSFSRGAFVAKAIARLLQDMGVMKFQPTPQGMYETWKQWQRIHTARAGSSTTDIVQYTAHGGPITVDACLAWDTVKAAGKKAELSFLSDEKVADCTHIRHAYHALSLNERRSNFKPMLWTTTKDSTATLK